MDATINALSNLLLKAIPTVLFFLFLAAYLKQVYFRPMAAILEERRKSTEGLRELSEKAFAEADEKSSAYDRALKAARAEINAENEKQRRIWADEQADTVAKARADAETQLVAERARISEEAQQAGADIQSQVQPLANQIIASLLRRRAA